MSVFAAMAQLIPFNSQLFRPPATCRTVLAPITWRIKSSFPLSSSSLASLNSDDTTLCCFGSVAQTRPRSLLLCTAFLNKNKKSPSSSAQEVENDADEPRPWRIALQSSLWLLSGAYVLWLFVLPYAPGDPAWAIKLDTINMLLDLSINFLYVLPFANLFGFHLLESPSIHPTAESLFNLVMGWTIMFAPLLFTDKRRNRFNGSLTILWAIQMFLTNVALIPYMAIRLNKDANQANELQESKTINMNMSGVEDVLTSGTKVVAAICGVIGLVSVSWFLLGRPNEGFGNLSDRWSFFVEYLANDRVGYAFICDLCLYSLFQPWLIGENLGNVEKGKAEFIGSLRFVPYLGLVAYLWGIEKKNEV